MRSEPAARIGATALLGLSGLGAITGCVISKALTKPYRGRRFATRVHGVVELADQRYVLLDDTEETRRAGLYGAFLPDGTLVHFGATAQPWQTLVARSVSPASADRLSEVDHVSWTGVHFRTPSDAGLRATETTIATDLGSTPAWRIDAGQGDLWAIHIHGMGSTRSGTLRGVQAAAVAGFTSLVVTYRNTAEGIRDGSGRPTLGLTEVQDVAPALEYARTHGAQRIILFGWSMGAGIALQLAHLPRWRGLIAGVVADSPVLDWRVTLETNCSRAGLPPWSARLAYPWLTQPTLSRIVGLTRGLDLDALDWTPQGKLSVPLLILQGSADQSTPWKVAARLADASPVVRLELFDADHTMGWNSDPSRWCSVTTSWLAKLLDLGSGTAASAEVAALAIMATRSGRNTVPDR